MSHELRTQLNSILILTQVLMENRSKTYDSLCTFGILGLGSKEFMLFVDKQRNFEVIDKKKVL